ncbi:hypothetical protein WG66_005334 [Moniliophthora roreri]|nr:hypothetical protein WG66_005334 [Moniliophthora roreri]
MITRGSSSASKSTFSSDGFRFKFISSISIGEVNWIFGVATSKSTTRTSVAHETPKISENPLQDRAVQRVLLKRVNWSQQMIFRVEEAVNSSKNGVHRYVRDQAFQEL